MLTVTGAVDHRRPHLCYLRLEWEYLVLCNFILTLSALQTSCNLVLLSNLDECPSQYWMIAASLIIDSKKSRTFLRPSREHNWNLFPVWSSVLDFWINAQPGAFNWTSEWPIPAQNTKLLLNQLLHSQLYPLKRGFCSYFSYRTLCVLAQKNQCLSPLFSCSLHSFIFVSLLSECSYSAAFPRGASAASFPTHSVGRGSL